MAVKINNAGKDRDLEALDILLKGKSDDYKGRVLEYVRNGKVDANDPTFILIAALGSLDVALVELPKQIEAIAKKYNDNSVKAYTELSAAINAGIKQLQEQTEEICRAEIRLKQQIDRCAMIMSENTAESRKHRDGSHRIIEISTDNYKKLVAESHEASKKLLAKFKYLGDLLEQERELRLTKPWRNAVNIPPLILTSTIVFTLLTGLGFGSMLNNNNSAKISNLERKINNLTYELRETYLKQSPAKK